MKVFMSTRAVCGFGPLIGGLTLGSGDFTRRAAADSLIIEASLFGVAVVAAMVAARLASGRRQARLEAAKKADALKLSEERYRLLLDQAEDAILLADAETGLIIEVNRAACQLLEASEKELVGQRHTILHTGAEREMFRARFAKDAKPGEIFVQETSVYRKSGLAIPVHMRASIVVAGQCRYFQAILRDLRPRIEADAAVRRSEGRLIGLFEQAPVAILETDFAEVGKWIDGLRAKGEVDFIRNLDTQHDELKRLFAQVRFIRANPAALRATGAPDLETFVAKIGPAIWLRDDLRAFRKQLEAIWNGRSEVVCEMRFLRVDGSLGHGIMHWTAPSVDGRLDLARTIVVFSDLSELREAEARLQEVEDRWQLAVRALNVGIFEKNYVTGRTYISNRWKEMIGFGPEELSNECDEWQARIHPEDRDRVVAQLHAHLRRENDLYRVEYRMLCQDGAYKWISACGRAVFDASGQPHRFIGAHMDISERTAAEAALRENEVRYRRLFEDNPNPMWVYDLETLQMLAVNSSALRHYGFTSAEFLSLNVFDIRPPSEIPKLKIRLAENWDTPPVPGIWTHRRKDGTEMLMRIRSNAHDFAGRKAMLVLAEDVTARHEAEERLRASEQRFRNLFENAAEGVYETAASGEFRAVNPALCRILGYSNPQHLIENLRSAAGQFYVDPSRRAEFFQVLGSGESVTGFESEVRRADGSVRWISENARAIRDDEGQIVILEGFVSDITERKRAEAVIRTSEERYRVLFEHSPVAIIEHDFRPLAVWLKGLRAAGVTDLAAYLDEHPEEMGVGFDRIPLVGVNEEAVRLARARSKAELIENLDLVLTEDALALRRPAFLAVWEGRQEVEGEITIKTLDGALRRTFLRWWLPTIGGEEVEWTQIVLLDLTAMRSAEAALAAERERLRVTLRAMAEALITTDTNGVVQFMNEAAERLTGWTAGAAIDRSVDDICRLRHEKTKAPVTIPVSRAINEHRVIDLPLQTALVGRQGAACLIDGRCAPMHDVSGQAIGGVVVFRDVTERARLEAELLRSSKLEAVGILAGGIAHDFNNILTVVMGNVTLAMLDSVVMEAAGRWLSEAERGVMRARDLTQQLLTFAKGGDPVRKAVQLREVVREAAEFALHGSKVRCEFFNEPDLWAADVDKGQIGQVVQNLVINAVQAMPEGGFVRISLKNESVSIQSPKPLALGKYVLLTIADTGLGIRAEHISRIFDPYFTTKQSGSGLGLATVYSIIRKHQGHIEVESELGRGTRFNIWLLAAPDVQPIEVQVPEKIERLSGRVLFMDDEETIRMLAVALLTRLGLEVTAVADGVEAVKRFTSAKSSDAPYRLVIMDLTVPGGMGGLEAMQELLKLDPKVRAIVSSGYSSDPVLANYRAHGFRGMVPKPYRFADLARTISAVLAEP